MVYLGGGRKLPCSELRLVQTSYWQVDGGVKAGAQNDGKTGRGIDIGTGENNGRGVIDDCVKTYVEILKWSVAFLLWHRAYIPAADMLL